MKIKKRLQIGVIGSAGPDEYKKWNFPKDLMSKAEQIGELLAKNNTIVVTGGKDGIMEAASKGAKRRGGTVVGVIKGKKRLESNNYTDIEVVSGMEADGLDELLIVLMSDALIVLGGGAGTLQEISIAYRNRKPIIALTGSGGWCDKVDGTFLDDRCKARIESATSPEEAVRKAINFARK